MDSNDARLALLEADDPVAVESPPDPSGEHEQLLRGILQSISARLSQRFDGRMRLEFVQDASYFGEILLTKDLRDPSEYIRVVLSNFDKLVTVESELGEVLTQEDLDAVMELVRSSDVTYVDQAALSQPYSGRNPHFQGSTWGYRYFAHL